MGVGKGKLEMRAAIRGDATGGRAGLELDYQHRLSADLSAFASGWAGLGWTPTTSPQLGYEAMAGLRWVW